MKYGDPNTSKAINWTPYSKSRGKMLEINKERKMIKPNLNKGTEFIKNYNLKWWKARSTLIKRFKNRNFCDIIPQSENLIRGDEKWQENQQLDQ